MLAFKLAFKNLMGAGLRTWLNVSVLSFAFVIIVFYNGMIDGWNLQARNDTHNWETGTGQLWHPGYDQYDPYSFEDAHALISGEVETWVEAGQLVPELIVQASMYPEGRMLNVVLKGIDPAQRILSLPTASLANGGDEIPGLIGKRMAASARLQAGDQVIVRWRDKNGTFDAREVKIVEVFNSNVPAIDNGQIWLPLSTLQEMTGLMDEATLFVAGEDFPGQDISPWVYKDLKFLMKDLDQTIQGKKAGGTVLYGLLLAIALLAIFDTQVLSIFRRQKEIGTYIAMGMTRAQVIRIFTVEGSAHSILAVIAGALYGIPLLSFISKIGIGMPEMVDQFGMSVADKIIPAYSLGLIVASTVLVILSATIVSYFPARRISKMKATDAIKGKLQ